MNALTHGLTAATMCICVENPEEFDAFQERYFEKFQPQDQIELDLVKEVISAKWRQERMWSLEAATIDFRIDCTRSKSTRPGFSRHAPAPPSPSWKSLLRPAQSKVRSEESPAKYCKCFNTC